MATKLRKAADRTKGNTGCLLLLYGLSNVGKTTSVFQSAPGRILVILAEGREPYENIEVSGRSPEDIDDWTYDTFDELMEFISNPEQNLKDYKTIFFDSISHGMLVLGHEVSDQAYQERVKESKGEVTKALSGQAKRSKESYGTMGDWTSRLVATLQKLTLVHNKYVIISARVNETPDWNTAWSMMPLYEGQMYGKNADGMYDKIGYVTTAWKCDKDEQGNNILNPDGSYQNMRPDYPPNISFEHEKAQVKWSGKRMEKMRDIKLDLNVVFGLKQQESKLEIKGE